MTYPGPPQTPDPGQGPLPPAGYPPPPASGYAPPGYPASPPGYPPAPGGFPPGSGGFAPVPRKRRKWPWIVTGIVVVVVAALIVVGLVFGRKGSGDPHTAANKFWTALVQHDVKKAETYVCSGKNLTSNTAFKDLVNALASFDIGAESGTGNTRTYPVTVHLSANGQTGDQVIITTVTKSTGEWFVCDLANR